MPNQCKLLRLTVIFILFDSFIGSAHTLMLCACDGPRKMWCSNETLWLASIPIDFMQWRQWKFIQLFDLRRISERLFLKKGNELNVFHACNCKSYFLACGSMCLVFTCFHTVFTFSIWIEQILYVAITFSRAVYLWLNIGFPFFYCSISGTVFCFCCPFSCYFWKEKTTCIIFVAVFCKCVSGN